METGFCRRLYAAPAAPAKERKREKPAAGKKRLGPEIDLEQAGRNLEELRKRKQLAKIRAAYNKIFDTQAGGRNSTKRTADILHLKLR